MPPRYVAFYLITTRDIDGFLEQLGLGSIGSPSANKSTDARRQELDDLLQTLVGTGSTGRGSRPGSIVSASESGLSEAHSPIS